MLALGGDIMADVLRFDAGSHTRLGHLRILGNVYDLPQDTPVERELAWRLLGWIIMAGVSVISWGAVILTVERFFH